MLDLQSALNVGEGFFFESEDWMEIEIENKRRALDSRPEWPINLIEPGRREACVIDPLLGTSVKLLSVMVCPINPAFPSRPSYLHSSKLLQLSLIPVI